MKSESSKAFFVHAFELVRKSALTPEELEDQERREIYIQDQRGAIQLAENRGIEKGMNQKSHQMVKQANRVGMSYEVIAKMFEMGNEL